MSDHQHATTYVPKSAFAKWFESRLPIAGLIHSSFVAFPVPRNLNYFWTFGAVLFFMLVLQIVTGVILAMHYQPSATAAFDSLEHIMRDVNYGWLLRYLHANGASMFFVAVYIHIFRNLYYGSYKAPREILYILGVIIYGLMMATAFLGYTLPWGQMSFWGATVITNILAAIPVVGDTIQSLLWGGYSVGNPTLNRFFSLHYLLPFMIVGVVIFFTTSTMLMSTPGAIISVPGIHGMRYMSNLGLFLFKDVISFGVSLYLVSYFGKKALQSKFPLYEVSF